MTKNNEDGTKVTCQHCGHEWNYTGDAEKPTCPSCTRKTGKGENK